MKVTTGIVLAVTLIMAPRVVQAEMRPVVEKFDGLHEVITAHGEDEITRARIKSHIEWLASDENEGRKTARGKLEGRVADYIEAELTAIGLLPRGNTEGTTYRQPFRARSWWGSLDHDHHVGEVDYTDPKNFGHEANSLGVAMTPEGVLASVDPIPADKLALLDGDTAAEPNTFNLVGLIEGTDPALKDEILVIGAHMDHIGSSSWGSGDKIFNGADDNGSGTTALLTLARALVKDRELGHGPARSVLFCWFSGEELGLLGSQYYASNPTVEWSRIKGMLNVDMIGRAQSGKVSVYDGHGRGQPNLFHDFHDVADTTLQSVDHNIQSYLNRSDQYPFYKKGVPVIFFFEGFEAGGGMNPDYHGRGDHADKIDLDKMFDITRFVYRHLLGAANIQKGL